MVKRQEAAHISLPSMLHWQQQGAGAADSSGASSNGSSNGSEAGGAPPLASSCGGLEPLAEEGEEEDGDGELPPQQQEQPAQQQEEHKQQQQQQEEQPQQRQVEQPQPQQQLAAASSSGGGSGAGGGWVWRTPLERSEPFWEGWYTGLSDLFLKLPAPKVGGRVAGWLGGWEGRWAAGWLGGWVPASRWGWLGPMPAAWAPPLPPFFGCMLCCHGVAAPAVRCAGVQVLVLVGTDRLDRPLTIGQMQGRFQPVLLPGAGHAVQEDEPERTAEALATFIKRFRLVRLQRCCAVGQWRLRRLAAAGCGWLQLAAMAAVPAGRAAKRPSLLCCCHASACPCPACPQDWGAAAADPAPRGGCAPRAAGCHGASLCCPAVGAAAWVTAAHRRGDNSAADRHVLSSVCKFYVMRKVGRCAAQRRRPLGGGCRAQQSLLSALLRCSCSTFLSVAIMARSSGLRSSM